MFVSAADAEHLLLHVRNVTPFLGEHILPHAPIARVQVFGPKDQLDILKSDDKFLAFRPEFYPSIGEGFSSTKDKLFSAVYEMDAARFTNHNSTIRTRFSQCLQSPMSNSPNV